ncbi:unnamed protein product [Schistosoma curassoni]|uniref:Uncharacterized protein n=1 Tax=Schistosoma curassoni TaxID=6186 RepID=A0A183JPA6_9TREM|nr:unnamed protein product [Schistosoma curassoni]
MLALSVTYLKFYTTSIVVDQVGGMYKFGNKCITILSSFSTMLEIRHYFSSFFSLFFSKEQIKNDDVNNSNVSLIEKLFADPLTASNTRQARIEENALKTMERLRKALNNRSSGSQSNDNDLPHVYDASAKLRKNSIMTDTSKVSTYNFSPILTHFSLIHYKFYLFGMLNSINDSNH